jgi:hypothetical protein
VIDNKIGTGKVATRGSKVQMHYTGKLAKNNRCVTDKLFTRVSHFLLSLGNLVLLEFSRRHSVWSLSVGCLTRVAGKAHGESRSNFGWVQAR